MNIAWALFLTAIISGTASTQNFTKQAVPGENCTLLYYQCADAVAKRGFSPNQQCVPAHSQCMHTGVWQTESKRITGVKDAESNVVHFRCFELYLYRGDAEPPLWGNV